MVTQNGHSFGYVDWENYVVVEFLFKLSLYTK